MAGRSPATYVHGYSPREQERLEDQARTLADLLHHDTAYPAGSRVLEAGCGVGAQALRLARSSPEARIVAMDQSPSSVREARRRLRSAGGANVAFLAGNVFRMPWREATFDHVFVCFVLEHLRDPAAALQRLRVVLRPGGTLTVIEGDHGSTFFHPDDADAHRAIQALVEVQARLGGDALIGRRLYPLLQEAGFSDVSVSPRLVYADASRPEMVSGFTEKTFTAMVEGAREAALEQGLMDPPAWERGIAGLRRAAEPDGTFIYCFFKGTAIRPG